MSPTSKLLFNGMLFSIILLLDRITKFLAIHDYLPEFPLPFVACNVTMNRGISWGWFHTHTTVQFVFVTLLIAAIILMLMFKAYGQWRNNKRLWHYSLILGGAVSNMVDRIWYGGVIDFIEVSCQNWYWPIFNVADMVIVFGIVCLVIEELQT